MPGDHYPQRDRSIEKTDLTLNLLAGDPEEIIVAEHDLTSTGIENGGKLEVRFP